MRLKELRIICLAVFSLLFVDTNAQVFLSQNFDSVNHPVLPAGWMSTPTAQWVTGAPNTVMPHALSDMNFSLNSAAHMDALGIDGSVAAADGAIITSPLINLPASAINAVLQFDVAYFGIQSSTTPPKTEQLILIVSTDGGTTWSDVAFVAPLNNPNTSLWDTRSMSIGAYAGNNNLKIGFRYNNEGGNLIGASFDNIKLVNGTDAAVTVAIAGDHPDPSTGTGYQLSGTNATVTGTVKNVGSASINNYYIKYNLNNGPAQSSALIATPLAQLDTAVFPAGLTIPIPANTSYSIKAWIEAAGDINPNNDTATMTTYGVPYYPTKRPVFEEGTGTWCGWCPRGAVFMDHFAANHVGAAAQVAVHNSDPMEVPAYDSHMATYSSGFPFILIDRTRVINPIDIEAAFLKAQNNFGFADLNIGQYSINANTISIPVSVKPVVDILNPRLALVITEGNVRGSGNNWPQNNYYSGGGSGVMGGWESQPDHVDDVAFHFVARSITPSPGGGLYNLPATLLAGTTYIVNLTATLDTGWKKNNLQYLVFLVNGNNTSVMNSVFTALPVLDPTLGVKDGMTGIETKRPVLYPTPAVAGSSYLSVDMTDVGNATVTVTDMLGKVYATKVQQVHRGTNVIEIANCDLAPGSYIVNLVTDKMNTSVKWQVVR